MQPALIGLKLIFSLLVRTVKQPRKLRIYSDTLVFAVQRNMLLAFCRTILKCSHHYQEIIRNQRKTKCQ